MNILSLLFSTSLLITGPPTDGCTRIGDADDCKITAQRTESPMSIDGWLDEADWQSASIASGFIQYEPIEGAVPSQPTEVKILYGDSELYVGATLYDDQPDAIMKTLGRRDEFNKADWFIVSIDSYLDRKTAYTFAVSAAGVQVDGITTRRLDTSWDAVWDAKARVLPDGWIVEMRIPYSMLRFSDSNSQDWGINFRRIIPRLGETSDWVLVPRTQQGSGAVSQYGTLEGLQDINPKRNLQVSPYTVSRVLTDEAPTGGLQADREFNAGLDFKYGITSNITLDATFNPDFGQVESDPATLNLSAFETVLREHRPFFVEGLQIFDFGFGREGSLLYTRRIGASNPIIGATKVSGRTKNGLSIGILGAMTGADFNPDQLYGVARVKQEIGQYSSVGGILTGFDRAGDPGSARRSFTGGLDWDLRFQQNRYNFDGHFSFSHRGQPGAEVNPETGFAFSGGFSRLQGIWTYSAELQITDNIFNTNDLGRLRRNNSIRASGGIGHQIKGGKAFGPFRRGSLFFFSWQDWSYNNRIDQGSGFFLRSNFETRGFRSIGANISTNYLFGGYDTYETRGLIPFAPPREVNFNFDFRTDSRKNWRISPRAGLNRSTDGGANYSLGLGTSWDASSRLSLEGGIGYRWNTNQTAWSANEAFMRTEGGWAVGTRKSAPNGLDDDEYQVFGDGLQFDSIFEGIEAYNNDGQYYVPVFGKRDTRTVDVSFRSNITFTPNLSLQLYSQLFVAGGQYDQFQLLKDADTLVPLDDYPKRNDFSVSSIITNVVLRCEYRPGSALFLVWSQSRRNNLFIDPLDPNPMSPFDRTAFNQLQDTFDIFPTNVFLIKFNYLFLR